MMQKTATTSQFLGRTNFVRLVFGLTIGLGAALLFWQQLMLGRIMLPTFGSVPTVWLVSLVVFQTVLLGAYATAHIIRKWPHWLTLLLAVVLTGGAIAQHLFYPTIASLGTSTDINPAAVITALLGLSGGSLFLLSLMSPLLQSLYASQPQPDAKDPYFLYAASNFGSFAGLLLFPLVLEPLFGVSLSQTIWFYSAIGFVGLLAICLMLSRTAPVTVPEPLVAANQTKLPYLKWLFYSFMPCALSFGATAHLISDIAPLPLLSMVPLALYLLTFVLAFSRKDRFSDNDAVLQVFLIAFYVFREVFTGFKPSHLFDILITLAVFFLIAWRCHRQLAALRPDAQHLTLYYMILALGGALGGIFNVFVVPFILPLPIEFTLFLLITLIPHWRDDLARLKLPHLKKLHILIFAFLAATMVLLSIQQLNLDIAISITPVVLVVALMLATMLPSVLAVSAVIMIGITLLALHPPLELQRDFFGVKRVLDRPFNDGLVYRTLLHGTTSHGMQQRTPAISTEPYLYYARGSGLYDAMTYLKPQQVGVVGLGMGAVACMPPKGSAVRYFEIDEGVQRLANKYFTFLRDCPADVVIGDARMTLAKDNNIYDLLLLDAFSSDAIPVHLLTQEMFEVYRRHVNAEGALVLHISNRYLNLRHVIAGVSQELNWRGAVKFFVPNIESTNVTASEYIVLSKNEAMIKHLIEKEGWIPLEDVSPLLWTDDHISIIPILNFGFGK